MRGTCAHLLRRAALPLALGLLLAAPSSCSSAGMVTVAGLASGSHLELAMTEGALVVEGAMEPAESVGCSYGRRHRVARCPVDGVGGVELQMNDAEDRVRVLTPLPLPLTVHLGGGSDKFVGNAEPDTCYSQGARRNRCVGGAGDDVCITGQMNSDCVGGPGDDVCRHGAGSDGCWGGPGDDVCSMGPGSDGCHGGPGDDRLLGGPGADQLYGGPGRDYCDGAPGVGHSFRCEEGPGG